MEFNQEAPAKSFNLTIVPDETSEALEDLHGRAATDYRSWELNFLEWLATEGKKPDRLEGSRRTAGSSKPVTTAKC